MGAYVLRRLLLIIPTLFGVMVINFALTQFLPGGPVEQVMAQLEGEGDVLGAISGFDDAGISDGADSSGGFEGWKSANEELREQVTKEFGLDRPPLERFFTMMWKYLQFDFGDSYFKPTSVVDLVSINCPFPYPWACGPRLLSILCQSHWASAKQSVMDQALTLLPVGSSLRPMPFPGFCLRYCYWWCSQADRCGKSFLCGG